MTVKSRIKTWIRIIIMEYYVMSCGWSVRGRERVYSDGGFVDGNLTTLAFWLRSSVVSVLNSLTTIMRAPPSFLVI